MEDAFLVHKSERYDIRGKDTISGNSKYYIKVLYVQAPYLMVDESTIEREYAPLESISDNYEKIVVSLDDVQFPQKDGIKHEQIWKFNPTSFC